ncbi:hypothetical protein EEI45_06000 [Erysipelothrix piscisicarius]|uniref:Uncharacterized protein n=1 Tax=Erysipelothrix piscisicarius TaxID=2485784 RepID=A0A3Q8S2W6_9FIRM|nr:hypothetical protein [Erysipelothrix piscisicarius]AZK44353.1 hypothetical protein EEI45_06000 [Erysipelothrix piscisicarius]
MVNFKNEEDGNILIMFAFILMFLLGCVALSTDVVLAMSKKDKLTEVAYLVREARLDITEEMLHSQQGQQIALDNAHEILKRNGIDPSQFELVWNEQRGMSPNGNYMISLTGTIILRDVYKTTTLKALGIDEFPIKVELPVWQNFTDQQPIWDGRTPTINGVY